MVNLAPLHSQTTAAIKGFPSPELSSQISRIVLHVHIMRMRFHRIPEEDDMAACHSIHSIRSFFLLSCATRAMFFCAFMNHVPFNKVVAPELVSRRMNARSHSFAHPSFGNLPQRINWPPEVNTHDSSIRIMTSSRACDLPPCHHETSFISCRDTQCHFDDGSISATVL